MNLVFYLISLGVGLSALTFVDRIFRNSPVKTSFTKRKMTKIGTVAFLFIFFISAKFFKSPVKFISLTLLVVIAIKIYMNFYYRRLRKQFGQDFLRFLELIILSMKMGHGFRASCDLSLQQGTWSFGNLLAQISNNVSFLPQNVDLELGEWEVFVRRIQNLFFLADSRPFHALDILVEFKEQMQCVLKFRRRSNQIWTQVLAQAAVVLGFYGLFMFYTLASFPFETTFRFILISGTLIGISIIWFFKLAKEPQWDL